MKRPIDPWSILASMPAWIDQLNTSAFKLNRAYRKLASQREIIRKLRAEIGCDNAYFIAASDPDKHVTLKGKIQAFEQKLRYTQDTLRTIERQLEDEKKVSKKFLTDLNLVEQQLRIANNIISTLGTGSIWMRLRWILGKLYEKTPE